jgi:hypothetical protein
VGAENSLLERYVFELRDKSGVISDETRAIELARELNGLGVREFEVLSIAELPTSDVNPSQLLGFDVAARDASFWSLLLEFPDESVVQDFFPLLNEFGLFSCGDDALRFLGVCQQHNLGGAGKAPFTVYRVHRLRTEI